MNVVDNGLGIRIEASDCVVGGSVADRNVICPAYGAGIYVSGAGGSRASITDNFIGCNAAGTGPLNGHDSGVIVHGGPHDVVVLRNVIGGSTTGVYVEGPTTDGTRIEDNLIGVDATGGHEIHNSGGILIYGGGATLVKGNVLSATRFHGVAVKGLYASGVVIEDNVIGLDATESFALGNMDGVIVLQSANGTVIRDNVIAGNTRHGIWLHDDRTTGTTITGNRIGLAAAGTRTIPNQGDGIALKDVDSSSIRANVITGSRGAGIRLEQFRPLPARRPAQPPRGQTRSSGTATSASTSASPAPIRATRSTPTPAPTSCRTRRCSRSR
jgi:parallel beta-helix repeat protein